MARPSLRSLHTADRPGDVRVKPFTLNPRRMTQLVSGFGPAAQSSTLTCDREWISLAWQQDATCRLIAYPQPTLSEDCSGNFRAISEL